jgi:hypothetical protein
MSLLIALDYDGTYTADPELWNSFIASARKNGHMVKILTMRFPHEEIANPPCEVVYTSRRAKAEFMPADIYIDDKPFFLFANG